MRRLMAIDIAHRSSRTRDAPASKPASLRLVFIVPLCGSGATISDGYRAHVEHAGRTKGTRTRTVAPAWLPRRRLGDVLTLLLREPCCRSKGTRRSGTDRNRPSRSRVECRAAQSRDNALFE